ncbi:MAG TPA: PQQ-binding-like beta-propeller repeat protein, partial [Gaiellaceae bacterium]|nr:PQQ-binding-like beta-propeller repeat protein [Gaiellaceae bacterium]
AVVALAGRSRRTTGRGVAAFRLRRPAALEVRAWAPGYRERTVRFPFQRRWASTLRLYRPSQQWTMYGAGARRTNAHPAIRLRPPFRVVWSRGIGSLVEFPAVVSDGVAYVGNYRGTVYALSMRNGRYVWRYDPPGGKMASSPAVWGDALVVHGMDGVVRVLDRATGRVRRRVRIGSPIESSPVVRAGVDYFGAWNGRIYALDLRTGRLRWTATTGYKVTSSAALQGRRLFIGDYGGRLLALDARTGRIRFTRSVNGRVYGTPAVAAGRVFVPSSTGNSLTAFTTGGRYLWRVRTGGYVYSSPAVWRGRVFFGSYDGSLYAVAARSGRVRWRVDAGGPVSGAAIVVDGVAYAGSTWGRITGVDARRGNVLLRFPHGEYVPVSGNGGRLLLHGYSRIWAVEPRHRTVR